MIKALTHLLMLGYWTGMASVIHAAPLPSEPSYLRETPSLVTPFISSPRSDCAQIPHSLDLSTRQTRQKKVPPFNPFGKRRRDRQVIV